jgi:hypothetical protein
MRSERPGAAGRGCRARAALALPGPLALAGAGVASAQPPEGSPSPSRVQLLERVVAVVERQPLLLSEVRALAVVRGLDADAALDAAIDERLMYAEASRVAQTEVSPEEEAKAREALLARNPALGSTVPEPDLRRLLHRQLAILHYVEFRFRPQVHVSDEEVRKAWEKEEAGPALEDAEPLLRARLERQALDERIEVWVEELRARAEWRLVGGPMPPID